MTANSKFDKNGRLREVSIRVEGGSAEEAAELYDKMFESTVKSAIRRSPWLSGSFYLVVAITMLVTLLAIARLAPAWSIVPVVLGGVLLLAVVGGFQLRQDDRLSEESFLKLMGLALGKLPSMVRSGRGSGHPGAQSENTQITSVSSNPGNTDGVVGADDPSWRARTGVIGSATAGIDLPVGRPRRSADPSTDDDGDASAFRQR